MNQILVQHPLSAAYPFMEEIPFKLLVSDIRDHGQHDTATTYEGMILDGWHRYCACMEIGIPCRTEEFTGTDPASFIISKNAHRRHLTESQRAAAVVAVRRWRPANSEENGLQSNRGDTCHPSATVAQMAKEAGVNERTVQRAKQAHEAGLGDTVRDGKISANKAAELARDNPELAHKVATGEVEPQDAIEQITGKQRKHNNKGLNPRDGESNTETKSENLALHARIEELTSTAKELLEENASMGAVMDADDKLSALTAENKKLREMNRVLNERVQGLQGECNEAKRAAKMWRAKYDKAERLAARG